MFKIIVGFQIALISCFIGLIVWAGFRYIPVLDDYIMGVNEKTECELKEECKR